MHSGISVLCTSKGCIFVFSSVFWISSGNPFLCLDLYETDLDNKLKAFKTLAMFQFMLLIFLLIKFFFYAETEVKQSQIPCLCAK